MVAVSAHPDDAVLSLGAALHRSARAGAKVSVLTIFAGDVGSAAPAGGWDRLGGFESAGASARVRRDEDRRACSILGVEPRWLPFEDDQYAQSRDEERLAWAVAAELLGADVVLLPGFPLEHPDHELVAKLLLANPPASARLGLYVEQPYAIRSTAQRTGSWHPLKAGSFNRFAKWRACRAYASQLEPLGRPVLRILRNESRAGGELVSWVDA